MTLPLGQIIYSAFKPFIKIDLLIGSGYVLGKQNTLTVDATRNVSDIVVTVFLPCLIFDKIVTNLENGDIKQIGIIGLMSLLLMAYGGVGSYICYLLGKPSYWKGGCLAVGLLPNISDLPIAYLQTFSTGSIFTEAQGDKGVSYICIFTAFQIMYQFNFGLNKLIGYDFTKQREGEDEEKNVNEEILKKDDGNDDDDNDNDNDNDNDTNDNDTNESSDNNDDGEDEDEEEDESSDELNAVPLTRISSTSSGSLSLSQSETHITNAHIRRTTSYVSSMNELIREYSQADSIRRETSRVRPGEFTELKVVEIPKRQSKFKTFLLFMLDNFKRPLSISLVLGIGIAMIPWLRALFVINHQVTLKPAPDKLPPLSFIMDIASYLGNACVPLGLLIIGATLSRLKIGEMPQGWWITPLWLTVMRLIIGPVIGCCVILGLKRANWFTNDPILEFVCALVWGLPNATSIIYITAFYTPMDNDGRYHQMDYLSMTYIFQYPILAISLPFLTTFTMKELMDY